MGVAAPVGLLPDYPCEGSEEKMELARSNRELSLF